MRPLSLEKKQYDSILSNFKEYLDKVSVSDSKIEFSAPWSKFLPKNAVDRIILEYTAEAYLKIKYLIAECSDEVGWHGLAYRTPTGFKITDVFTYPQTVTGATITCDADAYATWNMLMEDEVINNTRFHGHSHVNMGVTPSGVDMNFRTDLITKLGSDEFYIFMIGNKTNQVSHSIYDLQNNTLYESTDISVIVSLNGEDLKDWAQGQLKQVQKYTYTPAYNPGASQIHTPSEVEQARQRRLPTKHFDKRMNKWVVTSPYGSRCYFSQEPEGDYITI